ncbi:MAG: tRNA-binding protein [Candidatus Eremiobacteraeota bacterium]|nr:tRNA-binding protein [Candidatus Eremiobacteraeota bacterium]
MRVGTVVAVEPFPEARKPAYKIQVDFGEPVGRKWSSAQVTVLYEPADLVGKQVVAVVNFPPKRIAGFPSEMLILGVPDDDGHVVLLRPERTVTNGVRVY